MADRYLEHVIGCLSKSIDDAVDGVECHISATVVQCAIDLLEEQKAVSPLNAVSPGIEQSAKGFWYTCGACGWWLYQVCDTVHFDDRKHIHYCASCGRPVKLEQA